MYPDFQVHKAAHELLLAGLYTKWERVSAIIPDPPSVTQERDLERDQLLQERARILHAFQKGWISEQDAEVTMAPLVRRLEAIDKARKAPAERARTKAEVEAILATIENGWDQMPLALRQQVIKAYIPGGFKLYGHVLKATVADISVSVEVDKGHSPRPDTLKGWLGTTEAARRLGKHENTLNNWCRNGKIPSVRLDSGKFRIPEEALLKVGDGYEVAPDAWDRCGKMVAKFERDQADKTKDGLQLEALQTVSVDSQDACGIECVSRSGGTVNLSGTSNATKAQDLLQKLSPYE